MSPVQDVGLLERAVELDRLEDLLARACAGAGQLVAVLGPAGIGKTRLLQAAARAAGRRDMAVLHAVGGELERGFPFALVRQLVESALSAPDAPPSNELTVGAAALAAPLLRPPAADAAATSGPTEAVLHGLYWLVANLAERRPLLLTVDDVHWADPASLRFLRYLGRRLDGLGVVVALAAREDERDAAPGLEDLVADPSTAVLRPSTLTREAVSSLVRSRLSTRADDAFCRACHSVTRGNPFLLGALLDELARHGVSGTAAEAARVPQIAPPSVSEAVLLRLARLSPAAAALARAVAVLGVHAEYRHVVRLAAVGDDTAVSTIAALARAAILDDVRPLRFVHPIVRSAVYAQLGPSRASHLHRQAAALLLVEGAAVTQVALHLGLTDPRGDPRVVELLRAAAAQALAESAPEAAVGFLQRALREPPAPELRAAVLTELGGAETLVHHPRAGEHLAQALSLTRDPRTRAGIAGQLATVLTTRGDIGAGVDVLDEALPGLEAEDPELALALENDLIQVARLHPSTAAIATRRTQRLRSRNVVPPRAALTSAERMTLVNVAVEMSRAGEAADEAASLAARAVDEGQLLTDAPGERASYGAAVMVLVYADRFDLAERALRLGLDDARVRGSTVAFTVMSTILALLAYRTGALTDAEGHLSAIKAIDVVPSFFEPYIVKAGVDVLLERGELDAAEQVLQRHDMAGDVPDEYGFNALLEVRGRLRLAQGDPRAACEDLHAAGRRQERIGEANPAIIPWRSSVALAHAALGERDKAAAQAAEAVALARRFGAPRGLGIALRAAGLVLRGRRGLDRLTEAVATMERSGARLELARALTDLGAALRRAQRRSDARPPLRRGLDLAVQCGASALAERARGELVAAGARPRRPVLSGVDALTPSQRRVATMAAAGMSNAQIAQALFVSSRTIEMHLTGAYRKLGIASRDQLSAVLGRRSGEDDAAS